MGRYVFRDDRLGTVRVDAKDDINGQYCQVSDPFPTFRLQGGLVFQRSDFLDGVDADIDFLFGVESANTKADGTVNGQSSDTFMH